MKPKLIIFDLFGTLIFPLEKIKREDFFAFYQSLGVQFKSKEDINIFTSDFSQLMTESDDWQSLSQKLLQKFVPDAQQKTIDDLANFYKENLVYRPFDDVKGIINLSCPKAILTNAAPFLFSNLGLEKYFEIFTPMETKTLKPDPKAFLVVLNKLKVKPEEVLMVGDEVERDLIPAQKLGMKTVLVDREDKVKDYSGIKINSLREIKNILGL